MSGLTPNLGLFKYDPTVDGKETFSIQTALNDNWDILDTKAGSPETVVDGTTWYRRFTDGWKEMGGTVSLSEQVTRWVQPTLSANGAVGGSVPATYSAGGYYDTLANLYQIWNKGTLTGSHRFNSVGGPVYYTPTPINITQLYWNNSSYVSDMVIKASNDNNTWDTVTSYPVKSGNYYIVTIDTPNYYKYWWVNRTSTAGWLLWDGMGMEITATYKQTVANSITFPLAFQDTNYSFTFTNQDSGSTQAYISAKSTTGMSISNTGAGSASWTACGY